MSHWRDVGIIRIIKAWPQTRCDVCDQIVETDGENFSCGHNIDQSLLASLQRIGNIGSDEIKKDVKELIAKLKERVKE